ncbi:hypothetical protein BGZ76_000694 [Entomortierella beljakovae]|nr:hypothetical protein BGZ76_000694 [Entomortierella beljakovae]
MSYKSKRPIDSGDEFEFDDEDFEVINEPMNEKSEGSEPQETSKGKSNKKTKVEKNNEAQKNPEGETYFMLGPKKRLTVRAWQGHTLIDFREFFNDKTGASKPTKKGISLTKDQFQFILDHASEITRSIKDLESGSK